MCFNLMGGVFFLSKNTMKARLRFSSDNNDHLSGFISSIKSIMDHLGTELFKNAIKPH